MSNNIKTSRLLLRPLQLTDSPVIFEIRRLGIVHANYLTRPWTDPYEATIWVQEILDHKGLTYTASLLSDMSSIIGTIGISYWDTLSYMIHPSHWNQGYCTEALTAFLPELWKHDPQRLILNAAVMEGNTASQRVLEKCGFRKWDRWMPGEGDAEVPGPCKSSQEKEELESNHIHLDMNGNGRLSKTQELELKSAIEGLQVQTKPIIEPMRIDSGVTPRPRKRTGLIQFRYVRNLGH